MVLRKPELPLRLVDDATAELALVQAARRGDVDAQERLFLSCAEDLHAFVSRVVLGADDAQDIVQDTFVAAFTRLGSLRRPEAFRGWLRQIALRQVRRRFRTSRLLRRLGFAPVEPGEMEAVVSTEAPPEVRTELAQLARALRALPGEAALSLVLRRVEGFQVDEIADHLGVSRSTVKRRLAEAEAYLQRLQEEHP